MLVYREQWLCVVCFPAHAFDQLTQAWRRLSCCMVRKKGGDSPRAYTASRDACIRLPAQRAFMLAAEAVLTKDVRIPKMSPHQSAIVTNDARPFMQQEQNIGSTVSPRQH